MWIKSISIKNLRSIAELKEIQFSKGINVLVGANNSGKSTILRAISCLQPFEAQGDFRKAFGAKYLRVGQDNFDINICLSEPLNELLTVTNNFDANKWKEVFIRYTWDRRGTDLSTLFKVSGETEIPIQTYACNPREPNNFIYPYFARRKPTEFNERIDFYSASSIEETFQAIYAKIDKITGFPESEEFRQVCRKMFEFEISCHHSQNGKQAGYTFNRNSHIPINAMGEGTINLLSFLVHLLSANGKVFLIDELENDIHPKVLKILLELIVEKSKTNQFFISTHSNIVVKFAGTALEAKMFSLTMKVENGVPTSKVAEIPNTPDSRIKVLEDLGYDVFDFELWKAYLILEESSAESVINKILIPKFTPILSNKLRTIASGGITEVAPRFIAFLRLFVYVHTSSLYKNRAWVAVDGDASGNKIINSLKNEFPNWPKENFRTFANNDFENYYPVRFQNEASRVLAIKEVAEKRTEKSLLLQRVIAWANENPEEAKIEFETSAIEVINFLKEIEQKLGD